MILSLTSSPQADQASGVNDKGEEPSGVVWIRTHRSLRHGPRSENRSEARVHA